MVRCLALLAVSTIACNDVDPSCLDERWTLVIDDERLGAPCAVEVADDGTVVILTGGESASIVEVSADGSQSRVTPLPPASPSVRETACADLAIGADGTRWALVVELRSGDARDALVYRVASNGDTRRQTILAPTGFEWLLTGVAIDRDTIYLGGTRRVDGDTDIHTGAAFVAELDPATGMLEVLEEPTGLQSVRELAVSGSERLYVMATPPSIDYRDAHLLAIDPRSGTLRWDLVVGSIGGGPGPQVEAAIGLVSDVVVGSFEDSMASIERFDRDGRRSWRTEFDLGVPVGQLGVADTRRHLIALVFGTAGRPDLDIPAPRAHVIGIDGEEQCRATTALPESSALDPPPVLSGDLRSDTFVVVGERQPAAGIWVSSLAIE